MEIVEEDLKLIGFNFVSNNNRAVVAEDAKSQQSSMQSVQSTMEAKLEKMQQKYKKRMEEKAVEDKTAEQYKQMQLNKLYAIAKQN